MILQNRNRLTDIENKLMVTESKQGRDKLGVWEGPVHAAIFKMGNQWTSCTTLLNAMCQPGWERGLGKNGHMYMYG